jgi:hypothetical protein
MTSENLGTADEITIDTDEGRFVLWFSTEHGTYRVNIHGAASDLIEAVDRTIRPWWEEGEAVRRSFLKDMDKAAVDVEREYQAKRVFACDPDESAGYALDDPKHPAYHSTHADHYEERR